MNPLRIALTVCLLLLPTAGSWAQVLPPTVPSDEINPPGKSRSPGDLLNQFAGPTTLISGLAYDGTHLVATSSRDGLSVLFLLDPVTGQLVGTVPVDHPGESGLGYDTKRNLYVTANPGLCTIKGFDGINPNPVREWQSPPGTGWGGIAYDCNRDVYWATQTPGYGVYKIDAETGARSGPYGVAGMSFYEKFDVAFDPVHDELIVGGLESFTDQTWILVIDTPRLSWNGDVKEMIKPQGFYWRSCMGLASTPWSTVWHSDESASLDPIYELDVWLGVPPPSVDIKCNGGDAGVVVPPGTKVAIDFSVSASTTAGCKRDVFVLANTAFGFLSYDGLGPYKGWYSGFRGCYFTGKLSNLNDRALDCLLPAGSYKAFVGIDSEWNGRLDPESVFLKDSVDFTVR